MKKPVNIIILLSIIFYSTSLKSQEEAWCGTYDQIEINKKEDPFYMDKMEKMNNRIKEYLKKYPNAKDGEIYIVPLVFHIIHNYGEENISYETTQQVVDNLNDIYRNRKNIHSTIVPEFVDLIPDTEIEFRLAKIDPDGNCTLGITRTHSLVTYTATNDLYSIAPSWDNTKYLNVWLVNTIPGGVAGWSTGVGGSSYRDGLVFEYSAISGYTFAHEVAHSLNIAHTWGPTNEPDVLSNCSMDDGIEDTPETIGSAIGACVKDQVTCESLDNVQNIMDYSGCKRMFTQGQANVMRATLSEGPLSRSNLWTEANLIATGTNEGYENGPCNPIADFGWNVNDGCQGLEIQFLDATYNAEALTWNWEFEGGDPTTSLEQNPTVTFPNPGSYNVTLSVTNESGSSQLVKEDIINIHDTTIGFVAPFIEEFESTVFPENESDTTLNWEVYNDQSEGWDTYTLDTNQTLRVNNRLIGLDNKSSLISPNINVSEYNGDMYFTFNVAYARRTSDANDELKVYISTNCGNSWSLKYLKSSSSLATNGGDFVTDEFIPDSTQWREERINLTNFEEVNHFRVKFECTSQRGNALYIDDFKLGEIDTTTATSLVSVIDGIKIFPNPTKGDINIEYFSDKNEEITISISDMSGKTLLNNNYDISAGNNLISISNNFNLSKGVYILRIVNSLNLYSHKLIFY